MTDDPHRATISLRGVLVGPDGDVLVVKRASDNGWELPGGRLETDEDPRAGLARELHEETGLEPTIKDPVSTVSWRNEAGRGRFAVYFHCHTSITAVSLSAEHVDADWVPPSVAHERLSDPQGTAVDRVERHSIPL